MVEIFAEGAEEAGDVLQMFKGGPLACGGGAWQKTGRCPWKLSKAGTEVVSWWIRRPGLKSEGQRKAQVGWAAR